MNDFVLLVMVLNLKVTRGLLFWYNHLTTLIRHLIAHIGRILYVYCWFFVVWCFSNLLNKVNWKTSHRICKDMKHQPSNLKISTRIDVNCLLIPVQFIVVIELKLHFLCLLTRELLNLYVNILIAGTITTAIANLFNIDLQSKLSSYCKIHGYSR